MTLLKNEIILKNKYLSLSISLSKLRKMFIKVKKKHLFIDKNAFKLLRKVLF